MNPTTPSSTAPSNTDSEVFAPLRQTASLSAALLAARSPGDVRRLAVSAGALLGGGAAAILTYDPHAPDLRIEESEGLARSKAQAFRLAVGDSCVRELFERSAAAQNPQALEDALKAELGFTQPIVVPLGAGGKLRGIFAADARGMPALPVIPYALRQVGAVVAGALAAAEAQASVAESEGLGAVDSVTGLPERKAAEAHLRRELARAKRYRDPLSLVWIDVDHFDALNETRGYQAGDRVLAEIARLLVGGAGGGREMALCFRESDLAARWGADSFLVLLPATPQSGAALAGERFLSGLRQRRADVGGPSQSGGSAEVTASAAVVTFPDDGLDEPALLALAERLVTDAARAGGDRLVVAPPQTLKL